MQFRIFLTPYSVLRISPLAPRFQPSAFQPFRITSPYALANTPATRAALDQANTVLKKALAK